MNDEQHQRTPEQTDRVVRLANLLLSTISYFAETEKLTTGEAMDALFEALIAGAKASQNYQPKLLIEQMDAKIREAVGLQ